MGGGGFRGETAALEWAVKVRHCRRRIATQMSPRKRKSGNRLKGNSRRRLTRRPGWSSSRLVMIVVIVMGVLFGVRRIIAPGMRYMKNGAHSEQAAPGQSGGRNGSGENLTPQDDRSLDNLIRERSR